MTPDFDNFDAKKLFELKDKQCGYKYCPRCRAELNEKQLDGTLRMVCTNDKCDFIYYQNPVPAAGAIIVENDAVLLVKRAHPPRIGDYCLPAGFMEWREHPRDTAIRELKEETGLVVELGDLFDIYTGLDDPRANAVLIIYHAKAIGGKLEAGDDALEAEYFSFDNLPKNIAFESHIVALADYTRRFRKNL